MALANLQDMFPALPASTVESVLEHHRGDADETAKALLGMTEVQVHTPGMGDIFEEMFPKEGGKVLQDLFPREGLCANNAQGDSVGLRDSPARSECILSANGKAPTAEARKAYTPVKYDPNGTTPVKTKNAQGDFDIDALLFARVPDCNNTNKARPEKTSPAPSGLYAYNAIGRAPKRAAGPVDLSPLSLENKLMDIMSERIGKPVSMTSSRRPPKPHLPSRAHLHRAWWSQWGGNGPIRPPQFLNETLNLASGSVVESCVDSGFPIPSCSLGTGHTPTAVSNSASPPGPSRDSAAPWPQYSTAAQAPTTSAEPPPASIGARFLELLKKGSAASPNATMSPSAAQAAAVAAMAQVTPFSEPADSAATGGAPPPSGLTTPPPTFQGPRLLAEEAIPPLSPLGFNPYTKPYRSRSASPASRSSSSSSSVSQRGSLGAPKEDSLLTPSNASPQGSPQRTPAKSLRSASTSRSPSPRTTAAAEGTSLQSLREIFSHLGPGAIQDVLKGCNNDALQAYEQLEAMQEHADADVIHAPGFADEAGPSATSGNDSTEQPLEEKMSLLRISFPAMMDSVLYQALSEKAGNVDAAAAELLSYEQEAFEQDRKLAEKLAEGQDQRANLLSFRPDLFSMANQTSAEGEWLDNLDTTSRATLDSLWAAFPTADLALLKAALEVSDYQLALAKDMLRDNGEVEVEPSSTALERRSPSRSGSWQRDINLTPQHRFAHDENYAWKARIWEEEHEPVDEMQRQIDYWHAKAQAARTAGAYAKLKFCNSEKYRLIEEIKPLRVQMDRNISRRTNAKRLDYYERDLHNEPVHRAIQILDQIIKSREGMDVACKVTVITGKGLHSKDSEPKVRPAVQERLDELNIPWSYDGRNDGSIIFTIQPTDA